MIRSISAEFIKLKYGPIIWLGVLSTFIVAAILFLANYLDANNVVQLGQNPWDRNLLASHAMFSIFILIPFCVMFISTSVFIENHSQGWKFIYATPRSRTHVFFSKLISILFSLLFLMLMIQLVLIGTCFIIDLIMPEFEFRYYSPNLKNYFLDFIHSFFAVLGVIGIQFFLSLRFKGFLIPMSFGIIMFIVGFIVSTTNKSIALFSPYSYVGIFKNYKMFTVDKIGVTHDYWFSNVEMYSIGIFCLFIFFALILELRKNVT